MKKVDLLFPFLVVIHLLLLSTLLFSAWPEMILWPYLINQNLLPYRDIAIAHTPLLIFSLSAFYKFFGTSLWSLKIFSWVVVLITDLLIYWITKKLTGDRRKALFSLAFYVLWQPYFEGNGVWFDVLLAPLGLLTFYFLWFKKYFWSGFVLAISLLTKQTALWFMFPMILTLWLTNEMKTKSILKIITGFFFPAIFFLLSLVKDNLINSFYYWAVQFGIGYLPKAEGQVKLPGIKQLLSLIMPYSFFLLGLVYVYKARKLPKDVGIILVLLVWIIFLSLSVYPRWEYFHFQPAIPFIAILSGILFFEFRLKNRYVLGCLLAIAICSTYLLGRFYYLNWQKPTRFFEKETIETSLWLKDNTNPGDKIFILNSWDHLYALSNTLPATDPWIPTLSWYMDYQNVQDKVVSDLEQTKPKYIVFEPYKDSGLGSYRPVKIDNYIKANYTLKEMIAGRFEILEPK